MCENNRDTEGTSCFASYLRAFYQHPGSELNTHTRKHLDLSQLTALYLVGKTKTETQPAESSEANFTRKLK